MALVAWGLRPSAGVACGDVSIDKAPSVGPEEVASNEFKRLGLTEVSGGLGVVALTENLGLDRIVVGDVHEAVEEYEVVAEAESSELALDVVVSRDRGVAEKRE